MNHPEGLAEAEGPETSQTADGDDDEELSSVPQEVVQEKSKLRVFTCTLCDAPCSSLSNIIDHIRCHSREVPWSCAACEQIDLTGEADVEHDANCYESADAAEDDDSEDAEFFHSDESGLGHRCTLCSYRAPHLHQVVDHIRLHMRKRENKLPDLFDDEEQQKEQDNIYTCTECEFSCVRPDKLEKHMVIHAEDAVFRCKLCSLVLDNLKSLRSHIRTHEMDRPFACSICPARFTRADNMKLHMKIHSGNREYLCKLCPYSATNKSRMLQHYRAHSNGTLKTEGHGAKVTGDCPVCGQSYASYQYLMFHLKTHKLNVPYRCEHCQLMYDSEVDLLAHFKDHVDQMALSCAYCSFKCFDDSTIHNHLGNTHSGEKPFQCDVCGYRFSNMTHWKRHQLVHTGEKPYSCDICGARFCASQNRKAHMLKLHKTFIPLPRSRGRKDAVEEG